MILVTGGTGLVGSHLLYLLVQNKEQVKAIYRSESSLEKAKKVFKSYGQKELFHRILWVKADVCDYFQLNDIFEDITHIYHCAAIVSFDRKRADKMNEVNIEGTKHLIDLSLEHKVKKFCFVSSVAALGKYAGGKCTDEEALWAYSKNTSPYSVSKFYAENEVWRGAEEGLKVVIVNPATIIGFGDWEGGSSAIIKKINDGLNYYTPGSNGFVGVLDVVKALHLVMNSSVENERYLLVAENWQFKKLFTKIAVGLNKTPPKKEAPKWLANILRRLDEFKYFALGEPSVITKHSVETAYSHQCYSSTKIQRELNFEFQTLEIVIKETTQLYIKY